jgi:hypothetical protein
MTIPEQHNVELDGTAVDELASNEIRRMAKDMSFHMDCLQLSVPEGYSPDTAYYLQVNAAARSFAIYIADLAVRHGQDPCERWEHAKRMGDMALREDRHTESETEVS